MKWRVIIRFSLDDDKGSAVRNEIARILEKPLGQLSLNGITRTATGTWESNSMDAGEAGAAMSQMIKLLTDTQAVPGASVDALMDHLWIYADRIKGT